jgi:hypothetical protein
LTTRALELSLERSLRISPKTLDKRGLLIGGYRAPWREDLGDTMSSSMLGRDV